MFYTTNDNNHGLPHNPFKTIVAPRPIGWISTISKNGIVNLAPYSFFNGIQDAPPMIMFSASGPKSDGNLKDSIQNITDTGEFCVNIVSHDLKDAMNKTSGPYDFNVDEFELAGLEKGTSKTIKPPFVKSSPAVLECTLFSMADIPGNGVLVIGSVSGIHIADEHIKNGLLDITSYAPLARLGYKDYAAITKTFSLTRPTET